jgi:hypothetical protein
MELSEKPQAMQTIEQKTVGFPQEDEDSFFHGMKAEYTAMKEDLGTMSKRYYVGLYQRDKLQKDCVRQFRNMGTDL